MKTLDEVIMALRCTDPEVDPETKCKDCPYKESHINELWYVGPSCLDEMFADALHYLKEYQRLQIAFLKALADLEDNPPLTWDELKGMAGKPVWVEEKDMPSTWIIIWDVTENWLYPTGCDAYRHEEYGKTWQAYRKER